MTNWEKEKAQREAKERQDREAVLVGAPLIMLVAPLFWGYQYRKFYATPTTLGLWIFAWLVGLLLISQALANLPETRWPTLTEIFSSWLTSSYIYIAIFYITAYYWTNLEDATRVFEPFMKWLLSPTTDAFNNFARVSFVSFSTLAAGIILYILRSEWRFLYGFVEIIVGLIVAGRQSLVAGEGGIVNLGFFLVILTAGVYLVVRGLDNMRQGFDCEDDPLLKLVEAFQRRNC